MNAKRDDSHHGRPTTTGLGIATKDSARSGELGKNRKRENSLLRVGETIDTADDSFRASNKRKTSATSETLTRQKMSDSNQNPNPNRIPLSSPVTKPSPFTSNATWAKAQLDLLDSAPSPIDKLDSAPFDEFISSLDEIEGLSSRMDEMDRNAQLERDGMYVWMGQFATECQRVVDDVTLVEEEIRGEVEGLKEEVKGLKQELDEARKQMDQRNAKEEVKGLKEELREARMQMDQRDKKEELRLAAEGVKAETMEETIRQQLRQEFRADVEFLASMHRTEFAAAQESIEKLSAELREFRAEVSKRDNVAEENEKKRLEALAKVEGDQKEKHRVETIELVKEMIQKEVQSGTDRLGAGLSTTLRAIVPSLVAHALPAALENGIGLSVAVIERCVTRHHSQLETILPHLTRLNSINDILESRSIASSQHISELDKNLRQLKEVVKADFNLVKNYSDGSIRSVLDRFEGKCRRDGMQMIGFQAQLDALCRYGKLVADGHSTNDAWTQQGSGETRALLQNVEGTVGRRSEAHRRGIDNPPSRNQDRPTWTGPPTPSDTPSSRIPSRQTLIVEAGSGSLDVTIPSISHLPSIRSTSAASI